MLLERGLKPDDLAATIEVYPKTVERWITKAGCRTASTASRRSRLDTIDEQ